jgi:hypothetical protein
MIKVPPGLSGQVVYGSYVDEPLAIIAGSGGPTNTNYLHTNRVYSVAALTNSSGTIVERYRYVRNNPVNAFDADGQQIVYDASSRQDTIVTRRLSEHDQSTTRPPVSGFNLIAPPRELYTLCVYPWSRHAPSCTAPSSPTFRQLSTPAIDRIPQWQ